MMGVARLAKLCAVVMMLVPASMASPAQATTPHSAPPIPVPRPTDIAVAERMKGITPVDEASAEKELRCLAQAVCFEARSEPVRGQHAVEQVILNRVASAH